MARQKTTPLEPLYARLGARIATLRESRGLTQEALARLAQVTSNYVARTEGAYHRATLGKLSAIAEALGVTLVDLFASAGAPVRPTPRHGASTVLASLHNDDLQLVLQLARRLRQSRSR